MALTQYYCAATLDGFIADPDDGLDWLTKYQGSYEGEAEQGGRAGYEVFFKDVGALVMGSVTYEWLLREVVDDVGAGWPYPDDPTWVLSSRDLPKVEEDVRIGSWPIPELHAEASAAAGGRNVWIVGGGNVVSQFADEGLLDEVIVTVVPVVLGDGKPLFDRRLDSGPMTLTGVTPFTTGMVELRYRVGRA